MHRKKVDFPEKLGPFTTTNYYFIMCSLMPFNTSSSPKLLYKLLTSITNPHPPFYNAHNLSKYSS